MDTVSTNGEPRYDARGLVELDEVVPRVSEIDGERATFDAHNLTTRRINLELRWLLYEQGVKDVTVLNPGARHSLGAGILTRCRITFEGSLGYFACGIIDGPEVHITGRVGWSACENMMSGVVVIDGNAGSLMRRRGPRRRPRRQGPGRRAHRDRPEGRHDHRPRHRRLDDRLHDAARPPDHLRRRRPGPRRLDVRRHDLRRRARSKSLGIDCVPGEWTDADTELIERKFSIHELGSPPAFQKFVCGKKLYNYDNLEPSERKLVL